MDTVPVLLKTTENNNLFYIEYREIKTLKYRDIRAW